MNRNAQVISMLLLMSWYCCACAESCLYIKSDAQNNIPQRVDEIEIKLGNGIFLRTEFLPKDWQISIENSAGPEALLSANAIHAAASLPPQMFDGVVSVNPVINSNQVKAEITFGFDEEDGNRASIRLPMELRHGSCRSVVSKGKQL